MVIEEEKLKNISHALFMTLPEKGLRSTSGLGLEFIMTTHTDEACGEAGEA